MKNKIIAVSVLLLGIILSLNVLATPVPNTIDDSVFNTKNALNTIAEISEKEHSVFDTENHEEVRLYLKGELESYLGTENVYEYNYLSSEFDDEIEYDVKNLLGVIPGKSDTGILIVAHYDSRGHIGELGNSYGAADDGYGIALMLEVARLYADKDLENSIYLLMTDAEETGLYGAQKAAQEEFMDDIGFVINIEARGVKGPAYMFETSTDNSKVLDFYKHADLPVSYSLATAVYTVMPNSTDFTEFLAVDKQGINFAVLNGLYYYHTPHDNYTNVNPSSIEHYASQIMPLVDEFTGDSKYSDTTYFESDSDKVFFTLYKDMFVSYDESVGTVLHIIFFILSIGMIVFLFIKKEVNPKKLLISSGLILACIIDIVIIGRIVAGLIAYITKVPFVLTYVRTTIGDLPSFLTLLVITLLIGYMYMKKTTEDGIRRSIVIVGVLLNLFLALVTGFVLSGASFLFLIPGVSGLILVALQLFCKKPVVKQIVLSILVILNIMVILPVLYSLYLALTIGGLLALGVILFFYLLVLIPIFTEQIK